MRGFVRLLAAAGIAAVVGGASAGSAAAGPVLPGALAMTAMAAAQAAHDGVPVHGCPSGDVCLYNSRAHYRHHAPTVIDSRKPRVFLFGYTPDVVAVNNAKSAYSSEGHTELKIFKYGYICYYVPDLRDAQDPGTTENPADGALVNAVATGPTAESVEMDIFLPASDCGA